MKLVKIGNNFINPDKVVNIRPLKYEGLDKYKLEIQLDSGLLIQEDINGERELKDTLFKLGGWI